MSSYVDKTGLAYFWGKIKAYVKNPARLPKICTYQNPVVEKNLSGTLVHFEDGVGSSASSLVAGFEPQQSGSGDPSLTNVRPISGFTGAVIRCTRKNLWGGDALLADIKAAMPNAVMDDVNRTIEVKSNVTQTNPLCGIHNGLRRGFQFAENTQYTFIFTMYRTGTASNMRVTYTDGTYDNIPAAPELETKGTVVFVSDAGKTIGRLGKIQNNGTSTIYADESGIFEGVLTAEDFVPYSGREVTVEFPEEAGTVYGGILDVTAGTLAVTWAKQQITTVTGANGTTYVYTRLGAKGLVENYTGLCNILVNHESVSGIQEGEFAVLNSSGYNQAQVVYILPGTTGSTASERKVSAQTILDGLVSGGTLMEVAYMLAEPVTYHLTPVQISTLLGENNIYVDIGNVSVRYFADAEAAFEDDDFDDTVNTVPKATKAYSIGDYVSFGNVLCRATGAITPGSTIVLGGNVEIVNVGDELNRLVSSMAYSESVNSGGGTTITIGE